MVQIATVLLPIPIDHGFDYVVPSDFTLELGSFVKIPLGSRILPAIVTNLRDEDLDAEALTKLKEVAEAYPSILPLSENVMAFLHWSSRWTNQTSGQFLKLMVTPKTIFDAEKEQTLVHLSPKLPQNAKITTQRQRVMDYLHNVQEGEHPTIKLLSNAAGVSPAVIRTMVNAGLLTSSKKNKLYIQDKLDIHRNGKVLSTDQSAAVEKICQKMNAGFGTFLVDGITGSGKTEVYFEAMFEQWREDPEAQILMLLPEIALTQMIVARFRERFGFEPTLWHSQLTAAYKKTAWRRINNNAAKVVIGARSALYLPFHHLQMIIVDEEHDPSYKQDEVVTYHARDMAVMRAHYANAKCILGSATPSLESYHNAASGKYDHLILKSRFGDAKLPQVSLIDLRDPHESGEDGDKSSSSLYSKSRHRWLSTTLKEEINACLSKGHQTLLFLNRRGYAPAIICSDCGEPLKSPFADHYLSEHRFSQTLICHLTGFTTTIPAQCPNCQTKASFLPIGPGVERIFEETALNFPQANVEVISSDVAQNPSEFSSLLQKMEAGEVDILVGTQIIAKGYNFPKLTLVGVVDGDLGLSGADLRAAERTYQLLVQVAGRAGRFADEGKCVVQTFQPHHPLMQALLEFDRDQFFFNELEDRELLNMPPFGRLATITLLARDEKKLADLTIGWAQATPNAENIDVYGPVTPAIQMIRHWYRRRFLIRADKGAPLNSFVNRWRSRAPTWSGAKVSIDLDPQSFI